jgi:hypothetical protein
LLEAKRIKRVPVVRDGNCRHHQPGKSRPCPRRDKRRDAARR